jgi:hypothetical protein
VLGKALAISKAATRAFEDISKSFYQRAEVISAVIRVIERSCPPLASGSLCSLVVACGCLWLLGCISVSLLCRRAVLCYSILAELLSTCQEAEEELRRVKRRLG